MNKRICQIKQQSMSIYGGEITFNSGDVELVDLNKFAQLIIAECVELFVNRRYMVLNPTEPFANERVCVMKQHDKDTVKTIKQHFGV